jgi:hypothetical protein
MRRLINDSFGLVYLEVKSNPILCWARISTLICFIAFRGLIMIIFSSSDVNANWSDEFSLSISSSQPRRWRFLEVFYCKKSCNDFYRAASNYKKHSKANTFGSCRIMPLGCLVKMETYLHSMITVKCRICVRAGRCHFSIHKQSFKQREAFHIVAGFGSMSTSMAEEWEINHRLLRNILLAMTWHQPKAAER